MRRETNKRRRGNLINVQFHVNSIGMQLNFFLFFDNKDTIERNGKRKRAKRKTEDEAF